MFSPDLIAALVGLATFAAIIGGAALIRSYRDAARRLERESLYRSTRPVADGGRYVGGHDRPGAN
jgi:hypothetical protein